MDTVNYSILEWMIFRNLVSVRVVLIAMWVTYQLLAQRPHKHTEYEQIITYYWPCKYDEKRLTQFFLAITYSKIPLCFFFIETPFSFDSIFIERK